MHRDVNHSVIYNSVPMGLPCGSAGKDSPCNAGDLGSMPGLGKSPGEGNGNPLQYSCLENSMDRAWGQKESDMTERLSHSHCGEQYGGSRKTKVELPYGPAISLLGLYPEKRKKVKWISRVRLCDPTNCSPPGFSVHGIL